MPEYLAPGVYLEEAETGVTPIPGVTTSVAAEALRALAAEFRHSMRTHMPEWADREESDPGVTLLEVFAFLADGPLFRAGKIPERARPAIRRAVAALTALGRSCAPGVESVRRPVFFTGQSLDGAALAAEQDYQREKRRRHNRAFLGSGVVSGLEVRVEPGQDRSDDRIVILPGCAIDSSGEEIAVPRAVTFTAPKQGDVTFVTLRYWERPCPPFVTEAGSLHPEPPAVEEACVIAVGPEVIAPALALARLIRSDRRWQIDPAFTPTRIDR